MTTMLLPGQTKWSMSRDEDGHRDYKITFKVKGDPADGPASALLTAGLPSYGSVWSFGNDSDPWAWCRYNANVTPAITGEPNKLWDVEFTFSTKPTKRCQDTQIEDPLLIPPKISGSFVKYVEEAVADRFGNPILNSAHEQIRGPQNEWDRNRPQVKIEMNVVNLQLGLLSQMQDTLNVAPLWGLPARTIKLSEIPWERKFYGTCSIYYTWHLTFDIRYEGFDRNVLDEGTKVLHGHWDKLTGNWVLDKYTGLDNPQSAQAEVFFSPFATMPDGLYQYAVTAVQGTGETTGTATAEIRIVNTTTSGTGLVQLSWTKVRGATGYNVYRQRVKIGPFSETQPYYLASTVNLTYEDDGTISENTGKPLPTSDTTARFPNYNNPQHFDRFKDRRKENCRVILNGFGLPADVNYGTGTGSGTRSGPGNINIQKYNESDFTLLGIPLSF